jgi:hypothetical protein
MKMTKMGARRTSSPLPKVFGAAAAAALVAAGAATAGGAFANSGTYSKYVTDGKITFCHATGDAADSFKVITVGASDLSGHLGHSGDVVPPLYEGDSGLNFFDGFGNPDWYPGTTVTPQSCNPVPGSGSLVPSTQPFKVLIYDYHPDVLLYRNNDADGIPGGPTHRALHLAHARAAKAAGDLVNIGAIGPESALLPAGALIVFRGTVPDSVIHEYATTDPYHTPDSPDPDLIERYEIKTWTVVG